MAFDYNEAVRLFSTAAHVRQGIVRIGKKGDRAVFSIPGVHSLEFDDIDEAVKHAAIFNIKGSDLRSSAARIHPDVRPLEEIRRYGWYRRVFDETVEAAWNKKHGGRTAIQHISIGLPETDEVSPAVTDNVLRFVSPGGVPHGLPRMTKTGVSITQFAREQGGIMKNATTQEVLDFLYERYGMTFSGSDKLSKRIRAFMSVRGLGTFTENQIKVVAFDPVEMFQDEYLDFYKQFEQARKGLIGTARKTGGVYSAADVAGMVKLEARLATERMAEGMNILLDPNLPKITLDPLEREIAGLRQMGDPVSRMVADRLQSDLDRVTPQLNNAIANIRVQGAHVVDIHGRVIDDLTGGQVRGNIMLTEATQKFRERFAHTGAQIAVPMSNISTEVRNTRGSFFTLELSKFGLGPMTDVQTMTSMPDLFDSPALVRNLEDIIDRNIAKLRAGQFPEDFRKALQHVIDLPDIDIPEDDIHRVSSLLAQKEYARNIMDHLNLGLDVTQDKSMMSQLVRMMGEHYYPTADEFGDRILPRVPTEYSARSYLNTWQMAREQSSFIASRTAENASYVDPKTGRLRRGFITLDPITNSWVVAGEDMDRIYAAIGGGDLDDALVSMFRYDAASDSLFVAAYRQPNAPAERVLFQMGMDDPFIQRYLNKNGHSELIKERQNIIKGIKELKAKNRGSNLLAQYVDLEDVTVNQILGHRLRTVNEEIADVARRTFPKASDTFKTAPRFGFNTAGDFIGYTEGRFAGGEAWSRIHDTYIDDLFEESQKVKASSAPWDAAKGFMDEFELAVKTQYGLGQFSNARMFHSEFGHRFGGEVLRHGSVVADLGVETYSQEFVIDTFINRAKAGADLDTTAIVDDFYEKVGRYVGMGQYLQRDDIKIDRDLFEMKGRSQKSRDAIIRGIQDIQRQLGIHTGEVIDLEDYLTGESPFSSFMQSLARSREGYEDVGRELVDEASYPDFITKHLPDIEDREFGSRILREYDDLAKHYGMAEEMSESFEAGTRRMAINEDLMRFITNYVAPSATSPQDLQERVIRGVQAAMWESARRPHSMFNLTGGGIPGRIGVADVALAIKARGAERMLNEGLLKPDQVDTATLNRRLNQVLDFTPYLDTEMAKQIANEEATSAARVISSGRMTKIFQGRHLTPEARAGIDRIWRNDNFRKGALITAGLIGFAELYRRDRDRSPDDLRGQPLPGGGNYESAAYDYDIMEDMYEFPEPDNGGGVTYKINARGSFDPYALQARAESITGSQAGGTFYSAGPSPFKSTVNDIAEAFGR